jgi:hypothetical protein
MDLTAIETAFQEINVTIIVDKKRKLEMASDRDGKRLDHHGFRRRPRKKHQLYASSGACVVDTLVNRLPRPDENRLAS